MVDPSFSQYSVTDSNDDNESTGERECGGLNWTVGSCHRKRDLVTILYRNFDCKAEPKIAPSTVGMNSQRMIAKRRRCRFQASPETKKIVSLRAIR